MEEKKKEVAEKVTAVLSITAKAKKKDDERKKKEQKEIENKLACARKPSHLDSEDNDTYRLGESYLSDTHLLVWP